MSLLLLLGSPPPTGSPTLAASLDSLTASATVAFTPERVRGDLRCVRRSGRAKPVRHSHRLTGYRVGIQGERPFYMAAIPITGSTPPEAETVWIEDLSGVIVGAVGGGGGLAGDILDLCHEERLGEYEALWLTVAADSTKADLLAVDVVLLWRDRRFRISAREERRDGVQATIELEAGALWLDLADRRLAGEDEMALSSVTPSIGLSLLLARTNWTVGMMPTDATTHTFSDLDASVLELVRGWAKVCGYEVDFDTRLQRVEFVTSIGEDRGVGFRFGHNLREIERRVEPPKATRVWAYGRDNIDITAPEPDGNPYVTDYSYYTGQGVSLADAQDNFTKDEVWVDDSYVDDDDLYAAALARVAIRAQPTYSYTCKVIDLVRVGGAGRWTHSIGDTIGVRDETFDIDVTTRVVRLKRYPLRPYDNEVELSSLQPAITESSQTRSFPGSSEWLLYRDTNTDQVVLSGTTEQEFVLLPRFLFLDNRGEYLGDSKITATLSGSGVLQLRIVDTVDSEEIESSSWSFNSATFSTFSYDLPFSAKGKSGRDRLQFVGSITSGAGTATVAADDGLAHVLVRGLLSGPLIPPENIQQFTYTGDAQYWIVPDGITQIWASLYGADGGDTGSGFIGHGGYIKVLMDVVPNEVLQVNVGGRGAAGGGGTGGGGGWNGGGDGGGGTGVHGRGGGGASDLRRNAYGVADRIVVAGGGGGHDHLGTGGSPGSGGYPSGADASNANGSYGMGGTASAGGNAGGILAEGGDADLSGFSGGGGGGGGYYGGGAGNSGAAGTARPGGGGSSFYDIAQGVELLEQTTGANTYDDGTVFIEW